MNLNLLPKPELLQQVEGIESGLRRVKLAGKIGRIGLVASAVQNSFRKVDDQFSPEEKRLNWLQRDLTELINQRIQRFSLLEDPASAPKETESPEKDTERTIQRVWVALTQQLPPAIEDDFLLATWLAKHLGAERTAAAPAIGDYFARLALEAIRTQPASLLSPAQTAEFAREFSACDSSPRKWKLGRILTGLLELSVAPADKRSLGAVLDRHITAGQTEEEIFESLFARLRSPELAIHLNPTYFAAIMPDPTVERLTKLSETGPQALPARAADAFRTLRDEIFYELGEVLPPICFVLNAEGRFGLALRPAQRSDCPADRRAGPG